MHRGWVRLYRKLQDNPFWTEEQFTRGQAWVDLILIANYKDGHVRVRGVQKDVKRGQVGYSEDTLASRWDWSRGKVRRFMSELTKMKMIVQQKSRLLSIITILNYDEHQANGTTDSTTDGTTDGQQTVQQTDTNKKDKKEKKVKKEYIVPHLGSHKNVKITQKEFDSLGGYVGSKALALDYIEKLSLYLKSTGNTYDNHYATMQTWYRKDRDKAATSTGAVQRESW